MDNMQKPGRVEMDNKNEMIKAVDPRVINNYEITNKRNKVHSTSRENSTIRTNPLYKSRSLISPSQKQFLSYLNEPAVTNRTPSKKSIQIPQYLSKSK